MVQFVTGEAGMNGGTVRAESRLWDRSAAAQKFEIAAFDERDRVADQTIGRASRVGVFPLDRWKLGLVRMQDDLRDVARTAAHVVNVEGVKKLDETALALRGQSQRPWEKADGLATYLADETRRDIESEIDRCGAERQENHGASNGQIAVDSDVKLAGPIDDYDLTTLIIGPVSDDRAELRWVEGHRRESARRCI